MPGAMRKMGVYLGLVEDDDLAGTVGPDGYDREYERAAQPERAVATVARRETARDTAREDAVARYGYGRTSTYGDESYSDGQGHGQGHGHGHGATAVGVATAHEGDDGSAYRITTLHPRTYNEARTIGESFRSGVPVIMNLSEMDDADAKRLVDFAAGLTFGLHGRIERVTAKVFLLSPHNVTVTAQDKARIAEGGFFNQS